MQHRTSLSSHLVVTMRKEVATSIYRWRKPTNGMPYRRYRAGTSMRWRPTAISRDRVRGWSRELKRWRAFSIPECKLGKRRNAPPCPWPSGREVPAQPRFSLFLAVGGDYALRLRRPPPPPPLFI